MYFWPSNDLFKVKHSSKAPYREYPPSTRTNSVLHTYSGVSPTHAVIVDAQDDEHFKQTEHREIHNNMDTA